MTRPSSPGDQNQNSGISIIVKPGHPGGKDQVIQVIPQGANAEPQGAYGGLERAIGANLVVHNKLDISTRKWGILKEGEVLTNLEPAWFDGSCY